MTEHTPTPWDGLPGITKQGHYLGEGRPIIELVKRRLPHEADFVRVGTIPNVNDAAFIARAVNAHEALIDALEYAAAYFENRSDVVDGDYGVPAPNKEMRILAEINEALALARGEA